MKVLVMAPDQLKARVGGLRTQVERTTEELVNLGVEVDYFCPWKEYNFSEYDLCHVFSMNTPNYFKSMMVKDKLPLVYSSVMWRTSSRKKIRLFVELGIRVPYMVLNDVITCRLMSKWARVILPNTNQETDWLVEATGVDRKKCHMVPNGADDHFDGLDRTELYNGSSVKIEDDFIFCSSVVSTRKNLVALGEACLKLGYPLVIAGPIVDESVEKKLNLLVDKGAKITLLGSLPNDSYQMGYLYSHCRVFCLPSFYETPGISALEAGLRGANIVVTEVGGASDYFSDMALYVDPNSSKDIEEKLKSAWLRDWNDTDRSKISDHIKNEFSWSSVAEKTLEQYKKVLDIA
ncbi:glycosyltransferase family 4 protein [Vibrio parahaemolyticus]|nr:glycosyltransferase family 4 protein [Vibrio parahaemolyticus]MCX8844831.1 glycosyltransferase family 4 protein [Vibrio parahaemolyticus]